MLFHEIEPAVFHNEYVNCFAEEKDFFLGYRGSLVLAGEQDGRIVLPTVGEALTAYEKRSDSSPKVPELSEFRYLFSIDSRRFFTLTDREAEPFGPYTFQTMRYLRVVKPMDLAYAAAVGAQIHEWYRRRRFCGSCGHALEHAENERMMRCPVCGEMYYPVISPSVIIAVRNGEKILLTKYASTHFPQSTHNAKATYALVAGYIEIGETPEQCVAREVMEEVGLRVKNITAWKNQPWPFSSTLLLGYYCDLEGPDQITLQEDELSVAEWVRREDMPDRSRDISLTSNMMEAFRLGRDPRT